MGMTKLAMASLIFVLAFSALSSALAKGQVATQKPGDFPLWNFDETGHTRRSKGRLQDKEYCDSKLMDEIVLRGKDAIPILISQLTDTRPTKEPAFDYWTKTTSGDIAYLILNSLVTDSDSTTLNMPGLHALHDGCSGPAESCWRALLRKHGSAFVQQQWRPAWRANKDRVYWDGGARCFRLTQKE